jgi:hypothetical protein
MDARRVGRGERNVSRVQLAAGVTVQFIAQAYVDLGAYQGAGGTPQQAQTDVSNTLGTLGSVLSDVVTFDAQLYGDGIITLRIQFTPAAAIGTDSIDAQILAGLGYQPTVRAPSTSGAALNPDAVPTAAPSVFGGPGTVVIDSSVSTSTVGVGTAAPPQGLVGLGSVFATQQSTDPNANGQSVLADAAAGINPFGAVNWQDVQYVGLAALALGALVALAYVVRSVYRP